VEGALVVVLHGVLDETAYGLGVMCGIETRPTDQLTDLALDVAHRFLCGHAFP